MSERKSSVRFYPAYGAGILAWQGYHGSEPGCGLLYLSLRFLIISAGRITSRGWVWITKNFRLGSRYSDEPRGVCAFFHCFGRVHVAVTLFENYQATGNPHKEDWHGRRVGNGIYWLAAS